MILEWGLARDFGTSDVGQYGLALPAILLVAAAVWLTFRGSQLRRWASLGAVVAMVAVAGGAYGAIVAGQSARTTSSAAACEERVNLLATLPMYQKIDEAPAGYPDGGCYLRYAIKGDVGAAQEALASEMAAGGWTLQGAQQMPDGSPFGGIYESVEGVRVYADVEGYGNQENTPTEEGVTVFRLTIYETPGLE